MKYFSPLFVLLFVGCSITFTKKANFEFSLETPSSIKEYVQENNIRVRPQHLYSLKDLQTFAEYNENDRLSLPEILFFNKEGKQVENNFNTNKCTNILNDIPQINSLNIDSTANNITQKSSEFQPLFESEFNNNIPSVVIFFAKFTKNHKSINRQSFEWYELALQQEEVNIFLVSFDLMEEWNISEETKQSLRIINE